MTQGLTAIFIQVICLLLLAGGTPSKSGLAQHELAEPLFTGNNKFTFQTQDARSTSGSSQTRKICSTTSCSRATRESYLGATLLPCKVSCHQVLQRWPNPNAEGSPIQGYDNLHLSIYLKENNLAGSLISFTLRTFPDSPNCPDDWYSDSPRAHMMLTETKISSTALLTSNF